MTSAVQICNLALSGVGQGTIAALTEASEAARACSLHYETARDAALRDHPWNFATARLALASLGDPPADDWTMMYAWPSDCLNARHILPAVKGDDPPPHEVALNAGVRVIFTDKTPAVLVYTAVVTDPNLFDPLFIAALAWRLGIHLADVLTGDESRVKKCATMYENAIQTARAADANEGVPETPRNPSWLDARWGGAVVTVT